MMARADQGLRWMLQHVRLYLLIAAVLSLLAGGLAGLAYRSSDEAGARLVLEVMAQRHAVQLSETSLRGRAMGTTAMLGINEPVVKQLALGQIPPDAPLVRERLAPVLAALDAQAIFVLDANGRVIGEVSDRHGGSSGQQWQEKPFWQQAFSGRETVYPMAEGEFTYRFMILAAPIFAGSASGDNVIGVLAIKLPVQGIDASLRRIGVRALLLSPQGLVFASSDGNWTFSLARGVDEDMRSALREQFGALFVEGVGPRRLRFDPASDAVELLGERHLVVRASLEWPDASGRWQLVLLAAPERQVSLARLAALASMTAVIVFGLLYLLLRGGRNQLGRQLALARSEAASREVMQLAQLKARQSDLTLQLQRARGLPTLARTLFAELGRFLPVHQGCLYFVEATAQGEPRLFLAGSHATADAPDCLELGDGLLGQCAREQRVLCYRDVPPGFWRIESGLGQAWPRSLLLLPVMRNDVLLGVLELASMDADCSRIESVLEELLPVLAMNLDILLTERRLEHLLVEAREQAAATPATKVPSSSIPSIEPTPTGNADGSR